MTNCAVDVRPTSEIPEYARGSHGDLAEQTRRGHADAASTKVADAATVPPAELAARAGCMACHSVEKSIVGPAFADVAKRYHGDAGASAKLVRKVQAGGAGSWGAVPMPAQHVAERDLQAIVAWILGGLQ
jgi:cytochrome c